MKMNNFLSRIRVITKIAIIKTLYFNLKVFPFRQAMKLPVLIGRGTTINTIGKIVIDCPAVLGLISIGVFYIFNDKKNNHSIWDNNGTIILKGKVLIHTGVCIHTGVNGIIEFGGNNTLGINSTVIAKQLVRIGRQVGISWNVQIADTDFHFIEDMNTTEIFPSTAMIEIGNNVWIGNHVLIGKGSVISSYSVVAAYSLVNKKILEMHVLIAGIPAQVKRKGVRRIFSYTKECELNKFFKID